MESSRHVVPVLRSKEIGGNGLRDSALRLRSVSMVQLELNNLYSIRKLVHRNRKHLTLQMKAKSVELQ